jgi:drug/metabolite transporter (DMT)-like permease
MHPIIKTSTHATRGYLIALAAALFLSTTAIFIRHLTQTYQLPALILAFWRDVFVTLTLLPVLALLRPVLLRISRAHLGYLILYGLALASFNSLWTLSVALNGAAVATVLVYCSSAFTALLAWRFLGETLNWPKLLAIVLSLGGCTLVAGAYDPAIWQANLGGILTGVLSGLFYAIYSLLGRSASQRGLNPWTTLLYTFACAAVFRGLVNLLPGGPLPGSAVRAADFLWLGSAAGGWIVLLLLAAGPTVAGFGLYNISLSYLPSSVANLIVSLEPAFTAVIAYLLFGEMLTGIQIGGSLLILLGVGLLRMFDNPAAPQPEVSA